VSDRLRTPENEKREGGQGVGPTSTEKWAARASGEADDDGPRRGGRPKGSRDRKPRRRRGASAEPAPELEAGDTTSVSPADAPPTEFEIRVVGKLGGVLWKIAARRFNRRELTPDEQNDLAEAAIPVLNKYGGQLFEQWSAEITLVIVVASLWEGTELPKPATSTATVLEDDAA